jgi:hypothetical protein
MTAFEESALTVPDLLARMAAGRAELDTVLASVPGDASPNGWTIAQHMAHIACWEHSALALLRGQPRHLHLGLDAAAYAAMDTDAVNAHIAELFRDKPVDEVRVYYSQVHADLVEAVSGMSDAELHLPYSHYQPGDPPYNPSPVVGWLVGNTFDHYAEHVALLLPGSGAH